MKKIDGGLDLFGGLAVATAPIDEMPLPLREITPEELGLHWRVEFNEIVADSRKFAKVFIKRHDNVLAKIDDIEQKISLNLRRSFDKPHFINADYFDSYGRKQRCFDLTLRGALVLGAHYEPLIAAALVAAFEKAANALGERAASDVQYVSDVLETTLQRWHAHIEQTVGEKIKEAIRPVIEAVEWIQAFRQRTRIAISAEDKSSHRGTVHMFFGGRCPCCQFHQILNSDGELLIKETGIVAAEYDHFKQSTLADLQHTWLVCSGGKESCHYKLTHGPHAVEFRLDCEQAWANYQRRVADYLERIDLQEKLL